jgi:hypothetical protein
MGRSSGNNVYVLRIIFQKALLVTKISGAAIRHAEMGRPHILCRNGAFISDFRISSIRETLNRMPYSITIAGSMSGRVDSSTVTAALFSFDLQIISFHWRTILMGGQSGK